MTSDSTQLPPVGAGPAGTAAVDIADPARLLSRAASTWLHDASASIASLIRAPGEIRIRIVDDDAMAAAHERFSGLPGTTDVLTFDLRESPADPLDVDILICIDEPRRQADRRGHRPEQQLRLDIVHGLLHCLGHDDHVPRAAAAMHAEEDRLLESAGIGATYSRPEAGPARGPQ